MSFSVHFSCEGISWRDSPSDSECENIQLKFPRLMATTHANCGKFSNPFFDSRGMVQQGFFMFTIHAAFECV